MMSPGTVRPPPSDANALFCYFIGIKFVQLLMLSKVSATLSASVNAAGRNASVIALMICCGYVLCWSLNEISYALDTIGVHKMDFLDIIGVHKMDFSGWYYHFTVVMVLLNSCVNPFIYAAKYLSLIHI